MCYKQNYFLNPRRGDSIQQKDRQGVLFWGKRGDIELREIGYLNFSVCCNFLIRTASFLLSF
ncbi:hypothetical protein AUJ84_01740 [Candidatus Pacearchaeota archaeon CG1_02_32_132]|nr:MAG: hypothetical protein AUJ84_01740 [Candidatus Pacearchaeota archaeon CG1_02_32_132]